MDHRTIKLLRVSTSTCNSVLGNIDRSIKSKWQTILFAECKVSRKREVQI
jgi:hypothetical protein